MNVNVMVQQAPKMSVGNVSKSVAKINQQSKFGDVFSKISQQNNPKAVAKQETNPLQKLTEEAMQVQTKEELHQLLQQLVTEEEFVEITDILQNMPYMYNLNDLIQTLEETEMFESIEVLLQEMFEKLENVSFTDTEKVVALQQLAEEVILLEGSQRVTREQLTSITVLHRLLQEGLQKVDQLPIHEKLLESMQNLTRQLSDLKPEHLAQIVQKTSTHSLESSKTNQLLQQIQQREQLVTEQNRASQMKVESMTNSSATLSAKEGQPDLVQQRFQLNLTNVPEGSRAEKMIQELQSMMKRANFGRVGGMNRITVQVYPEQLGQIRIELQENKGMLTARILASVAMTKDLLERQMHQLRQALGQHTQVERIEIVQMLQETPRQEREQMFQQQRQAFQQGKNEKDKQSDDEEELSFDEFLAQLEEVDRYANE